MNLFAKFFRTFGLVLLFLIATALILMTTIERELGVNEGNWYLKYSKFPSIAEDAFYDYRLNKLMKFSEECMVSILPDYIFEVNKANIAQFTDNCGKEKIDNAIAQLEIIENTNVFKAKLKEYSETPDLIDKFKINKEEILEALKEYSKNTKLSYTSSVQEAIKNSNKKFLSSDIVLVKIDDESLEKINMWPIPRENWAHMLNKLKAFGSKVISFDVMFPEKSMSATDYNPDEIFRDGIKNYQANKGNSVILAYTVMNQPKSYSMSDKGLLVELPEIMYNELLQSTSDSETANNTVSFIEKNNWPISKLLEAEPKLGYINNTTNYDGVFRYYQLAANMDSLYFPSLAFKSYLSLKNPNYELKLAQAGHSTLRIEKQDIHLNPNGELKVRWSGYKDSFESISLYKVLAADDNNEYLKKFFKDKIVYIGSTANGAHDLRNTPIDSISPGVYAHINATEMLIQNFMYRTAGESILYSFVLLVISLILLILIMKIKRASFDILGLGAILLSLYFLDMNYFLVEGFEIKLFIIFFCLISSYSFVTFINFQESNAEKKQIKGAFSRYVAPTIVDDMLANPEKLKVGGEKRNITCLFSDVRDFTSISENLTPTELSLALNKYMGAMTDIVFDTEGTLDKYIGDAIVAFWGAPIDIGDHVNKALGAAVEMLEILPDINREFKEMGFPEFKIGLGLNSGDCSLGNMGSDKIFAYTALGDNMNLGARLESSCKHYGAQILISEYTFERMDQERFTSRLIDKVVVKGKTQPVGVYEVLYSYHPMFVNQSALKQFKEAYQLFSDGQFKEALNLFEKIHELNPDDKSTNRLIERCKELIQNPPKDGDDWTITIMTTK